MEGLKSVLQFPVKHVEENLIFSQNGEVWAFYLLEGFNYSFLSNEDKMKPFYTQLAFLNNNNYDLHYICDPTPTDVSGIIDQTIDDMGTLNYDLRENGIAYMKEVKKALGNQRNAHESTEYRDYIGIQLNPMKNNYLSPNVGNNLITKFKHFLEGLNSPVYSAVGLEPYDIPLEVIEAYKGQSDSLVGNLSGAFQSKVKPVTTPEVVYLVEKVFSVSPNYSDIDHRPNFDSGLQITGIDNHNREHEAVRPKEKEFIDIQNTNIDEVSPKTLLLRKVFDNEISELYTQHLICYDMDDRRNHPGFEWVHVLKSRLGFPISISIRASHQPNDLIKKKLSNKRLEYKDQRKEAHKGGEDVDLDVSESEKGTIQMENYFKNTAQPAFGCSFVIKVSAKDKKILDNRVKRVITELSTFGIAMVAPYGEQINLMVETIPGAKKYNNDYEMIVAPGVLAGMMFGSTSNVGDNRGYYLGYTKYFNKPFFVKPDLAAKAIVDSAVDSISVLVAGMTGRGKSFFMNLFVYLATLTGSQGLVIDPKGDRADWDKGLPFIPPEYISVWTLGSDDRDAGSLDPFRTSTDINEAIDICMDILSYLANLDIDNDSYTLLSEVVEGVSKQEDPCIGGVIIKLQDLYENRPDNMTDSRFDSVEKLKNTLETLNRNPLASLLFGKVGQNYRVLHSDVPLQVLMVQNLNLPGKETKKLRPTHKISEAIMISITAFTKQYMFNQDRMRHKFILQDEASAIERNAMGSELMDFIVRMGRYYNTTLLKGSQNASDHGKDVANMGMKFSFALKETDEAIEMLDYLNLPQTKENIDILKNLGRGEALFQDIYGRSEVVQVFPVFEDLFDAFDSSTSTKEEREREMRRPS